MISFTHRTLRAGATTIECPYPIHEARLCGHIIVVLFDPSAAPTKGVQFANLYAYDEDGQQLWVAEMPTTVSADAYYKIISTSPLVVYSMASYECEIDTRTGKLLRKAFYK